MYENYDVAIIGGGPAAVFAAYEFTLKYPTVSLIMLEESNRTASMSAGCKKSGSLPALCPL